MGSQGEGRAVGKIRQLSMRGGNRCGKAVLSYLLYFGNDCLFLQRKYGPECRFDFCSILLILLRVASWDRGDLKFFSVHHRF